MVGDYAFDYGKRSDLFPMPMIDKRGKRIQFFKLKKERQGKNDKESYLSVLFKIKRNIQETIVLIGNQIRRNNGSGNKYLKIIQCDMIFERRRPPSSPSKLFRPPLLVRRHP